MPAYEPEQFVGNDYGPLEARRKTLEARRLFLLKQASEAAQIQNPSEGRMVSGWYVPPSALGALQKPLAQFISSRQQKALDEEEKAYAADEKSAASAVMARMPAARTEQTRMANPPGEEPGYLDSTKTTQPSREDKLKWAQEGMQVPSLRQTLSKYVDDQLVNEPVRQEAREEKRLDREDRQAEMSLRQKLEMEYKRESLKQQAELRREQLQQQADDAKRRSEDTRLGIDQRREAAAQHSETMKAIASMKTEAARSKMSDKARSDLDQYNASAQGLDVAIAALDKASDKGTGYLAGLVTDKVPGGQKIMSGRRDTATNDAIQQLTYWSDAIRHERFGATFTPGEKASAAKYLPDEYDDLDDLKRKATGLRSLMDLNHRRLRAQYGDEAMGGNTGQASGSWGDSGGRTAPAQNVPSGVTVRRVK